MSLPLTRRIARAALLIAAGAAPVVGAAGSAHAAALPAAPELGGLTAVDGADVGDKVDGATKSVTGLTDGKAVPSAEKVRGDVADSLDKGGVPSSLPKKGLPIG
ncbi:ATP-binding protein [Streptomyces cavernae]|uniref:ATP-binding protein n=1 Tax=Streptomyces cavernae TaxID=2259034 RepID=UPI000FEBB874|nr:ATP-binding protein [Streptomyces cavernae]